MSWRRWFGSIALLFVLCAQVGLYPGSVSAVTPTPTTTSPTKDEQIADLTSQLADMTRALERKKNETSALRKQRNEARNQVAELQATVDALQTQIAALPTAVPTSAPTPTPTEVPETAGCATPEELAYYEDLFAIVGAGSNTFGDINDILADPEWYNDAFAISDYVSLLNNFHGYYQQMLALTPPTPRLQELHDHTLAAYYHLDLSATYFERGINSVDADLINSASTEMQLGTDETNKAVNSLDQVKDELCLN